MQILTDILSLFKRKQIIKEATPEDLLVLGRHEEPDMLGIASPIPYKSVKLIRVKDLLETKECSYANIVNGAGTSPARIYSSTTPSPCTVNLRTITAVGNNLRVEENVNEIEISTEDFYVCEIPALAINAHLDVRSQKLVVFVLCALE